MGYSSRYHAASLAAVFIALAIGILIGIGLADDVVSTASQELESSLRSDLDDAQGRSEELQAELDREQSFAQTIYPALVSGRLAGSSVALIGIGSLPESTATDAQSALEPTGAKLGLVAELPLPPDLDALIEAAGPQFADAGRDPEQLQALGRALGSGVAGGSRLLERSRGALFSEFSGSLAGIDRVVVVPAPPSDLDPEQLQASDALTTGFYEGLAGSTAGVAGAERTEVEPGNLGPLSEVGIPTVDHVDLVAGKVALVFSLLGAEGDYGVKDSADRFLPELIDPRAGEAQPEAQAEGGRANPTP